VDETLNHRHWPELEKYDAGLMNELMWAGLRELGLHELASCFVEAKELMLALLAARIEADGDSQ
jgi:hypothetical protein